MEIIYSVNLTLVVALLWLVSWGLILVVKPSVTTSKDVPYPELYEILLFVFTPIVALTVSCRWYRENVWKKA